MDAYYIIAKNDQKYYYRDGKRITEEEGKRLKATKKSPDKRKSSPKKSSSSKKCPDGKIENPATGKCVNKDGAIGKAILGKKSPKKSLKKSTPKRKKSRVPCKSHQERNEKTGRCVNKSEYKRKKSLVRDPVSRINKSKRWSRVKKVVANCVKRSNLELRDLQIKVVEYMEIYNGLLVVHGTGCGKTLTSLACSQCYLDKYPERGVVFVGPASLTSNLNFNVVIFQS